MDMNWSNFEAVVVDMAQEAVSDIKLFAADPGDDYSALDLKCLGCYSIHT